MADFTYDWEYWVGPDGRMLYVSPSCERITGYGPEEFLREPSLLERILHPEDRERFTGRCRLEPESAAPHSDEFRLLSKSGEERWIGHVCQAVHGRGGEWLGRRASNRDITDRVRMEAALQEKQRALWERTRNQLAESRSLQRVATALLDQFDLGETLRIIGEEARRLTGASGSAVLLREDPETLTVAESSGEPVPSVPRISAKAPVAEQVWSAADPDGAAQPPDWALACYPPGSVEAVMALPLRAEGRRVGAIEVVNKAGGFGEDDLRIMRLFASQAAVGIEKARLHRHAAEAAVIEERHRLARELHDSVTQALYSVTLFADAARLALDDGDVSATAEHLQELRNMAREAMLDMRVLIFELHPPALEEEGLAGAIQARLATVEARAGLTTEFRTQGEGALALPLEEELWGFTQEALNNVVKHAKARHVTVELRFREGGVSLEVRDDGVGFDPTTRAERGGLGLRGLEGRMRRVGGAFDLQSAPGRGTTVRADVEFERGARRGENRRG